MRSRIFTITNFNHWKFSAVSKLIFGFWLAVKVINLESIWKPIQVPTVYSIDQSEQFSFSLNKTEPEDFKNYIRVRKGKFYITDSIDYETTSGALIYLNVNNKTDPNQTCSYRVKIIVENVNDCIPKFTKPITKVIEEKQPIGTVVTQVSSWITGFKRSKSPVAYII